MQDLINYWDQFVLIAGKITLYLALVATFLSRLLPKVISFSNQATDILYLLLRLSPSFGTNPQTKKLMDELKKANGHDKAAG